MAFPNITPATLPPPGLEQHQAWAQQFYQQNGRWPTQQELAQATSGWWNDPGRTDPGYRNYATGSARQAADAFMRRRGRMPGIGEMPFALSDLARERAVGSGLASPIEELPGDWGERGRAVGKVGQELNPLLSGAGSQVFKNLANTMDYDYARYGAQQNAPSFYDYLRQKAQTLTSGGQGEQFGITPLTWEQVSGGGASEQFKKPSSEMDQAAVIGAWLAKFAPGAVGDLRDTLQNKLQGYVGQQPRVGEEGFGDYLGRMMQGYLSPGRV